MGNSDLKYEPATTGGPLPAVGPQTYVNAAIFEATGTQDDIITAAAPIPTEVGRQYILNFDLSTGTSMSGDSQDFNPSVGTPLIVIYPFNSSMPCTGTTCPVTHNEYVFYSLSFVASSTTTLLSFGGRNEAAYTALTNVAVCTSDNSTTTFMSK